MVLQVCVALASFVALPLWESMPINSKRQGSAAKFFLPRLSPVCGCVAPPGVPDAGSDVGGLCLGGVTLRKRNFIYDAVTPQKRVRCTPIQCHQLAWRFF
jgi:hypothetical protein